MKNTIMLLLVFLTLSSSAADWPRVQLATSQIRAWIYLPSAQDGFYRATRFDWSGMIGGLEFAGHQFYGPWFDRVDPKVVDFVYTNDLIVAGPSSAASGPAEEFQTRGSALGFEEAKVGETFIKIGVGVLRKDAEKYTFAKLYEIVDPGRWTVRTNPTSVEFTHDVADPSTGYGYHYQKTVKLLRNELVLEHQLKNTGRRVIQTSVYNHNFLTLDRRPPGPDFIITVPYPIQSSRPPLPTLAQIRGNQILYLKNLEEREVVQTPVLGFGAGPQDNEIRVENRQLGVGIKITGSRPLSHNALWSIRTVLSMEPFISMTIPAGDTFSWSITNMYYLLPNNPGTR